MRISPVAHNFTKTSPKSPSFTQYANQESADFAKGIFDRAVSTFTKKTTTELWEILGRADSVTLSKKDNALWCQVERSHFDKYIKMIIDLGANPETAPLVYEDFLEYVEDPMDSCEKKRPVTIAKEGLWGPITDPQIAVRIAEAVFLRDPKRLFECRTPVFTRIEPQSPEDYDPYAMPNDLTGPAFEDPFDKYHF